MTDPLSLAKSLGRPVALGYLDDETASLVLAHSVADHWQPGDDPAWQTRFAVWLMRLWARRFAGDRGLDEARIRRVIWPMCEEHKPGRAILAAADHTAPKTMRQDEVLSLCRSVAGQTMRRRRVGSR